MYLLRTIQRVKAKDDNGDRKIYSENWYQLKSYDDLIAKVYKIDPTEYQCFEAEDLTQKVFFEVERLHADAHKAQRRLQYEKLKEEFAEEEMKELFTGDWSGE